MKHTLLALAAGLLSATAFSRTVTDFHDGWMFAREDGLFAPVVLPHDWAIAGPFDPAAKGGTGKLPWKGAGVYRRVINLPEKPKGRVFLEFDGVMGHSTCYVNGQPCGVGEYGYLGFRADATPYLMAGSNTVEVKCDTRLHHSRWYPGAGIYRDVRLVRTDDLYLDADELRLSTEEVMTNKAKLSVDGAVTSRRAAEAKVEVVATLRDAEGKVVAEADDTVTVDGYGDAEFSIELKAANPHLWELRDGAYLYTLEIVAKGEGATDSLVRKVGFREFRFDKDNGFILNGKRVQLNGVDLHSDLGPLGMAFSKDAMRRQLAVMRDMGVNAFRTSHNPPAPQVLDLCDEMGIFVWDEAFDKWNSTCGRSVEPLEEFVIRQLETFVKRDRNHACVFVWSIGNEISPGKAAPPGQDEWAGNVSHGTSVERCARFRHAVRRLDDTRPVGIGSCFGERVVNRGDYLPLDITGWNYRAMYRYEHAKNPDKPVLYTESASALSEYGFYGKVLPTNKTDFAWNSMEVTSYDYNAAAWSDIPDWEFYRMEVDRYCGGEFVWTGIDYLGEPTPYNRKLDPKNRVVDDSRSSYFGICDLCAFPKDRFYLYRAHWNREAFTLHLAPEHWNFPSLVGKKLPAVFAYTSADEAELFLNGRSLGRRTKAKDLVPDEKDYYSVLPRYRLIWKDVPYEPGELKVVAYGKDGSVKGTEVLHTAGEATKVVLSPERVYGSLCVVKVTLADKDGVFVPNDRRSVRFAIEGGEILAVGNSNPRSYASFKDVASHPLHYGRAAVYVKLTPGKTARLTASSDGVAPVTCTLPAK